MPYFIISTILFVAALIILYWIHNQYHLDIVVTPAKPPAADAPLISLCIPARNEERNIRNCVESALAQDYPNIEVIVLDDRSTDSTLTQLKEIASRDSRLLPISGSDLPEGWAGKPHALFQASAVARGEWLCFVDSDTFLNPDAISSCYAKALETKADLFTTLTQQVLGSFWEKVVMPLVMTALSVGFSPRKVNDPKRRDAIANGQFILIRRTVYDAIGGHEKVKDQIVEDKAISEQVKWNGYRLIVADGLQVIRTRMYTSLETMWEGWTKNIYLGLHDHPAMLLLGAFGATLALLVALFLPVWPMLGVAWYLQGGGWLAVGIVSEALIVWGVLLLARAQVARKMHISAWYAWTVPLGAGVFAAMMIASAWKVISGQGVTWRGRKYHPAK
ncbi:MAG: glycosyltransferase [Anaerolineales bacterium]|jgi:chlorobactene glucosyltransferase|uniref:glycosyltransferase n=1 Tax=Candidatus Villigracilis affinis TaxID=3140682 RepID=UPI002A1A0E98|nr:glycosyltransferase [Anaerolineales bacterium]MBL0346386.1 glycosyltransferase [Anaerolineales bacterium]